MKLKSCTIPPWLIAGLLGTAVFTQAQAAELIQNGGFEVQGADSYDIAGWQVAEQGFFGGVLAQSGNVSK